ncbi:MAG: hypothetical protein KUG81_01760 [Gammaproteobacteria bacterium]|nr:hypothetical protein [Gammaproteobacteria bacterium]
MKIKDYQKILRYDLTSFTRFAFDILHYHEEYHHNWHIDALAQALMQVSEGKIKRLIINMPPRTLKSHCISIAWVAYMLGRDPRQKFLYLHASNALGRDLDEACHELMQSPRYRALFPSTRITIKKSKISTSFGGHRQFMSINGRLTGLGADFVIIDDPISTADARDPKARLLLHQQFDDNISQRLNNDGAIILVMQRLHEDDLTAHLLAKNEGWVHLELSAIALRDEVWELPYGRTYQRSKGGVLHASRKSHDGLLDILDSIGGYAFSQQYLQSQYTPRFGDEGHGSIFLTPFREGEVWDPTTSPLRLHGFYRFDESDFIRPKVFCIGEDPYPKNMRSMLTVDEWTKGAQILRDEMLLPSGDINPDWVPR